MARRSLFGVSLILAMGAAYWVAAGPAASEEKSDKKAGDQTIPAVVGEWTGEWGPFNPAKATAVEKEKCKALDCKVVYEGGVWKATFEGECGRPYKYNITMDGRQSGDSVLFKGSADLGEKDGGVYDWVGRARGDEFIGFYTSAHVTGVFHLAPRK